MRIKQTRPQSPINESAPPDPGVIPGGIRDRAMRAVLARGSVPEDKEKTQASREFWRLFREGQKLVARAEDEGARLGRPPAVEVVIKKTKLPKPHLIVVTTKVVDQCRLRPSETFVFDDSTGEVTDLTCFASAAAALMHHDAVLALRARAEDEEEEEEEASRSDHRRKWAAGRARDDQFKNRDQEACLDAMSQVVAVLIAASRIAV